MKVGTDGVLLGAWCNHANPNHILDIGTGTGLIALMLAQRFANATIEAIDIDGKACDEAQYNVGQSKFSSRITVGNKNLLAYSSKRRFDLIVCNPPFFINGLKTADPQRNQARHVDSLSLENLVAHSANHLNRSGRLAVIIPSDQEEKFVNVSRQYAMVPHRITRVRGNAQAPVKRCLIEVGKEKAQLLRDELIVERDRHVYTEAYQILTRDFYLNM